MKAVQTLAFALKCKGVLPPTKEAIHVKILIVNIWKTVGQRIYLMKFLKKYLNKTILRCKIFILDLINMPNDFSL